MLTGRVWRAWSVTERRRKIWLYPAVFGCATHHGNRIDIISSERSEDSMFLQDGKVQYNQTVGRQVTRSNVPAS